MMGSNGGVALGRAQLRAAGGAGGIGTDRRLHRRRRLCGGARLRQCHRLRHGRHHGQMRAGRERPLLGQLGLLRGRLCAGLSDQVAGHRHRRGRLRRRLDRLARSAEPPACRPAERRLDAGPGLLRPWRHRADRDRCQSAARPAQSAIASSAASCKLDAAAARAAIAQIAGPLGYAGERRHRAHGRRHPVARHRDHGRRHQANLDRAWARSARVRAVLLWRRRAVARECARARAVDPDRGGAARARQFLGGRHAARRCAARPVEDLRGRARPEPRSRA